MQKSYGGSGYSIESLETRTLLSGHHAHPASRHSVPESPTNLVQTKATGSTIHLNWTNPATNAKGFVISRLVNGNWKVLRKVRTTDFTDTKLTPGTFYAYKVVAYNSTGTSTSYAFIGDADTAAAAPTQLVQSAYWNTAVTLRWNVDSQKVTGQTVLQLNPNGNWDTVATLSASATSYTVTGLHYGANYAFEVYGQGFGGQSDTPAFIGNATTTIIRPASPSTLTLGSVSPNSATLLWSDTVGDQTAFRLEESFGGDWTTVAEFAPNITSYTVPGLTQDTPYNFRLFALSVEGDSATAVEVDSVATPSVATLPAPTNVIVTPTSSTSVVIQLTDNSTAEQSYLVEKSSDATHWYTADTFIGSSATGPRMFAVNGLYTDATIYFRVTAQNGAIHSPSVIVNGTTPADQQSPYPLANGKTLSITTTTVPDPDPFYEGYGLRTVQTLTRRNPNGTLDTTYGDGGSFVVNTFSSKGPTPFFNFTSPVNYLRIMSISPEGAIAGYTEETANSYGGGYPQSDLYRFVDVDAKHTAYEIVPGGENLSQSAAAGKTKFTWNADGSLVGVTQAFDSSGAKWFVGKLRPDLTEDTTFGKGFTALPGLYSDLPDSIATLPNGSTVIGSGKQFVALDAHGNLQLPGFTAPTKAVLNTYGTQSRLQFESSSVGQTGYILRVKTANSSYEILVPPFIGSGTMTFENAQIDAIPHDSNLELFAVNGSLRSGDISVERA